MVTYRVCAAHHVDSGELSSENREACATPAASIVKLGEHLLRAGLGSIDADGDHYGEEGEDVQNEEQRLDPRNVARQKDVACNRAKIVVE